jgi:hypothetical protein
MELTVGAVKVGNSEDIGSAALRGGIQAAAGNVDGLAVLELGRGSEGDAGKEGDDGGGELHLDGLCGCCVWLECLGGFV